MALPFLAQAVIGLALPKVIGSIGKRNNWDPTFTSLLSLGAGFGVGAAGAGAFSGGTSTITSPVQGSLIGGIGGHRAVGAMNSAKTASSLSNAFKAPTSTYNFFDTMVPPDNASGLGAYGSAGPYKTHVPVPGENPRFPEGPSYWEDPLFPTQDINHTSIGSGTPSHGNAWGGGSSIANQTTWDKLKAYGKSQDGQSFLKSAAGTLVDGLFAERPPVRSSRSGGGGGGGGPRAPAYPGGGGAGQKQVVWGFGQGGFNPQQVA